MSRRGILSQKIIQKNRSLIKRVAQLNFPRFIAELRAVAWCTFIRPKSDPRFCKSSLRSVKDSLRNVEGLRKLLTVTPANMVFR